MKTGSVNKYGQPEYQTRPGGEKPKSKLPKGTGETGKAVPETEPHIDEKPPEVKEEAVPEDEGKSPQVAENEGGDSPQKLPGLNQDGVEAQQQAKPSDMQRGQDPKRPEHSGFQQAPDAHGPEHLPAQFGKLANMGQLQYATPRQMPRGAAGEKGGQSQTDGPDVHQGNRFEQQTQGPRTQAGQRDLPPPRSAYRQILAERAFQQGPMAGSLLHQKLQQRLMLQQLVLAQTGEGALPDEALSSPEILQLFRLRSQFDKKDEFRQVLRHELAKARQQAREKIQQMRFGPDTGGGQGSDKTGRSGKAVGAQLSELDVTLREQLAARLGTSSGDSAFEKVLRLMLEGYRTVPELAAQMRARFAAKTDGEWNQFFTNMLAANSQQAQAQMPLSSLMEALFRGLFTQADSGQLMMVSDFLTAGQDGSEVESKFARLAITNNELAQNLRTLSPGDVVSSDWMKVLGDTLSILFLNHVPEGLPILTEQQKQEALQQMRQKQSSDSRRKLEDQLLATRPRSEDEDILGSSGSNGLAHPIPVPVKSLSERFAGRTHGFNYLFYSLGFILFVLLMYILIRNI